MGSRTLSQRVEMQWSEKTEKGDLLLVKRKETRGCFPKTQELSTQWFLHHWSPRAAAI